MILYDTLQPEDQVYDLVIIEGPYFTWELYADCKKREHVNDHGPQYHYRRRIAAEDDDRSELEALKLLLEKYRKA